MMFRLRKPGGTYDVGLACSELYSEQSFYPAFLADIRRATSNIIIESPFIAYSRFKRLLPHFKNATERGITITINTRDPQYHESPMQTQAYVAVAELQALNIRVLFTGNHHRKLAIIDQDILWEGSLNILSQSDSCEMMRRIESVELATEMVNFTGLKRWYSI